MSYVPNFRERLYRRRYRALRICSYENQAHTKRCPAVEGKVLQEYS